MYRSILVATDGSPHATRALDQALQIAIEFGAELHVLYVVDTRHASSAALKDLLHQLGDQAIRSELEISPQSTILKSPPKPESVSLHERLLNEQRGSM
jgi:nucleotide-binding universal stress UspA family protein